MQITYEHQIIFDASESVKLRDIANSLIANEKIISAATNIIAKCYPGLDISNHEVYFKDISLNSPLKFDILIAIAASFQEDIKNQVPKGIEAMFGVDIPAEYRSVVTLVVLLIAVFGIDWVYRRLVKKTGAERSEDIRGSTINGNYNTLNVAAPLLDRSPETLRALVEASIPTKDRPALARSALALIRPAKASGGNISGGGAEITRETVIAAPNDAEMAMLSDAEDDHLQIEKQRIVLHAWDIDKGKTGWGGVLDGVYDKRIRLQLLPNIPPEKYARAPEIVADVIVLRRPNADGEPVPYLAIITEVHE